MQVTNGNLDRLVEKYPYMNGWFFGYGEFQDEHPEFHSDKASVKWIHRKEGEIKTGARSTTSQKTIVILLDGEFQLNFPDIKESIELKKFGDFAIYDTIDSNHTSLPLRDSLILVVRTQEN